MATGGYDFDFVDDEQLSGDHECPICLLVLRDPQMVSCCGRKYCNTCIGRVNAANKPCPMCNLTYDCMAEKQLNRRILDLKIKCSKSKYGCDWVGEIRQLDNHQSVTCLYTEVACSLGCGESMQRQFLERHVLDECIKRPVESRLLRITQKLETKINSLELKCDEQGAKIQQLEKDIDSLHDTEKKLQHDVISLKDTLRKVGDGHHTDLVQNLRAIEGELIRRCFCFSLCLNADSPSWVSPTFLSHQNGYVLQLSACMKRYQSVLKSFVRSVFQSGGRPDRYPISLSLDILPQQINEGKLDWPVYVTVSVLILTNTDAEANAKLITVTCFKGSPSDVSRDEPGAEDEDDGTIIGHANRSFNCHLVIIKIEHGCEPPEVDHETLPPLF